MEPTLKSIVDYCRKHSVFYRRRLKGVDCSTKGNFSKIPLLKTEDVIKNYNELYCVGRNKIIRIYTTSSTSGTYKYIPLTRNDLNTKIEQVKMALIKAGMNKDDYFIPLYVYGPGFGGHELLNAAERIGVPTTPVSLYNPDHIIGIAPMIKPSVMFGLPANLFTLGQKHAQYFKKNPISKLLTGGELLTKEQKTELRNIFHSQEIIQLYGCSESGFMGIGFDGCDSIHYQTNDGYNYIEILNPETLQEARTGTPGILVVTSLKYEAYPFLRYIVGDLVVKCRCSCGKPQAIKILGRYGKEVILGSVIIYPSQIYDSCHRFLTRTGARISELELIITKDESGLDILTPLIAVDGEKSGIDFRELFTRELAEKDNEFMYALNNKFLKINKPKLISKKSLSHKVVLNIKDLRK